MRNRLVSGLGFGVLVVGGGAAKRRAHHRARQALRPGAAGLRRAGADRQSAGAGLPPVDQGRRETREGVGDNCPNSSS